ncbi:MAG: hypothetical protein KAV41_01045 [Candidatus Pacebacteria bacterium]|nr:hypothetical protein [Candidatus Paceibacterota bacterium]
MKALITLWVTGKGGKNGKSKSGQEKGTPAQIGGGKERTKQETKSGKTSAQIGVGRNEKEGEKKGKGGEKRKETLVDF